MSRLPTVLLIGLLGSAHTASAQWRTPTWNASPAAAEQVVTADAPAQGDSAVAVARSAGLRLGQVAAMPLRRPVEAEPQGMSPWQRGALISGILGGAAGFAVGLVMENVINEGTWSAGPTSIAGAAIGGAVGAVVVGGLAWAGVRPSEIRRR